MYIEQLLTIEDAAEFARVTPRTIRQWISDGSLRALRLGKRIIRIDFEDLRAFCQQIR
jgi:excisionase family DNA binding protein